MKRISFLIGFIFGFWLIPKAQVRPIKIVADSFEISSNTSGNNALLIIKNSTRGRTGAFLQNYNGGRTRFSYVIDSAYVTAGKLYLTRSTHDTTAVTLGGGSSLDGSQGDIIYFSGTNTIANLPKNTDVSRYLSNQGSSNNPVWAPVNLENGVTSALQISNGGTGETDANGAINALLPSQGAAPVGAFLKTDGTNTSWAVPAGGSGSTSWTFEGQGGYEDVGDTLYYEFEPEGKWIDSINIASTFFGTIEVSMVAITGVDPPLSLYGKKTYDIKKVAGFGFEIVRVNIDRSDFTDGFTKADWTVRAHGVLSIQVRHYNGTDAKWLYSYRINGIVSY